jgi:indolepyruvate ferredoxin oxidoreductase alpha subunit
MADIVNNKGTSPEVHKLLIGNGAVARGLYEAGCVFVSSYPGTPSTEITEEAALYDEIYAEWAPNEKVAVESALGASIAGGRAFSGMKHVGLNVAADPVFTASYSGVGAGLVIAVADDQGMHSSQNEQDSRNYAIAAKLPMLEPSDSGDCLRFTKRAFELSEQFDVPVLLRLSTRVAHSQSIVTLSEREGVALAEYTKNAQKYVMAPANAKVRRVEVEKREQALREFVNTSELNRIEWGSSSQSDKIGVIAAGIAYEYAREALGDDASYLKLGIVNPLPEKLIKDFAAQVDRLYVIEELDDIIETFCKKIGVKAEGKSLFSFIGEYNPGMIRNKILGTELPAAAPADVPVRPPVLCPGCPHRGMFYVLSKMKLTVSGDIGCYTLGASAPLSAMDTTICMGASIGVLHGMNAVRPETASKSVAVIGDSTFIHSGITGLINIVYNQTPSTVIILDNSITAMTGHQQNPATSLTLKNKPAPALDLEAVCRAVGVKRVRTVDPFDLKGVEAALKEELSADEPSVIIAKRPCVLLKSVKKNKPLTVDALKCTKCKMCMRIGCPALVMGEKSMTIDPSLCVGCDLCAELCKPKAIGGNDHE